MVFDHYFRYREVISLVFCSPRNLHSIDNPSIHTHTILYANLYNALCRSGGIYMYRVQYIVDGEYG